LQAWRGISCRGWWVYGDHGGWRNLRIGAITLGGKRAEPAGPPVGQLLIEAVPPVRSGLGGAARHAVEEDDQQDQAEQRQRGHELQIVDGDEEDPGVGTAE
jgi:hypothetical protein